MSGDEKHCPLTKDLCKAQGCAWWIDSACNCSVFVLAEESQAYFPTVDMLYTILKRMGGFKE